MIDGKEWLVANIRQAQGISAPAWKTVADFALLWSLFEAKLCEAHAGHRMLVNLADGLGGKTLDPYMNSAFDYWKARYVVHGATNDLFNELFVEPGGRDVAEAVLLADAPDDRAKLRCILLIVYRLRNNLFHGNKEIPTFNDQKDNLDHATAVLAKVMEWEGIH